MKSYVDNSKNDNYPKTLFIHNTEDGCIWQVYHVQKESEAEALSFNAKLNAFQYRQLVDYKPDYEETWPDWRETDGGKEIIK